MTDAGGLLQQYQQSVAAGRLLPDEGQAACVTRLSTLADQLVGYSISLAAHRQTLQEYQVGSRRFMSRLLVICVELLANRW